jgi:3',5'-cyclic AMP phosphodiesterase CpdA
MRERDRSGHFRNPPAVASSLSMFESMNRILAIPIGMKEIRLKFGQIQYFTKSLLTMNPETKLTRREMLELSAGSLLALGLWPGALRAAGEGNSGEFNFIVVNDLHYLDSKGDKWFEQVVTQMKATPQKPEFCLIVGDYAEHGKAEQLAATRDLFKELGLPTYGVIGNHDYLAQDNRKPYEQLFPDRINYRFEHKGWQFLGLDSTQGQLGANTRVQAPTLQWLEDHLPKLDKKRPTVVFTHFPLGALTPSRPVNADDLLERFRDFNLRAVFCGHFHGFTERQVWNTILTTNRCCSFFRGNHDGTAEKGYFLCEAKEGTIKRQFVEVKVTV